MFANDFKKLRVYEKAFSTAVRIFELSKSWPSEERFALTDQIRRSSRAICANIAEAWFKRPYPRHFASKLSDASNETAETPVWIDFALSCGYLSKVDAESLSEDLRAISGGLIKMLAHPDRWCSPSLRVGEETAAYHESS